MDDLSLDDLLSGLEAAQQKTTHTALLERNVVELVQKLHSLGLLAAGELLHTADGQSYVTAARLSSEVRSLARAHRRLSVLELPSLTGVSLPHCQAAAERAQGDGVALIRGELFAEAYWEDVAAEAAETLAEEGSLAIAALAQRLDVSAPLLSKQLTARLGQGSAARPPAQLRGGTLCTPAFERRLKARLRGALRGCTAPAPLAQLLRAAGLDAVDSARESASTVVAELAAEGSAAGQLRQQVWTPALHLSAQSRALKGAFAASGALAWEAMSRRGVADPRAFAASELSEAVMLEGGVVGPAVLQALESAVEEGLEADGWAGLALGVEVELTAGDAERLVADRRLKLPSGARLVGSDAACAQDFLATLRSDLLARVARVAERQAQAAASSRGAPAATPRAAPAKPGSDSEGEGWGGKDRAKKGGKGRTRKSAKGGGESKQVTNSRLPPPALSGSQMASPERLEALLLELRPALDSAPGALQALAEEWQAAAAAEAERAARSVFAAGAEVRQRARAEAAVRAAEAVEKLALYERGLEAMFGGVGLLEGGGEEEEPAGKKGKGGKGGGKVGGRKGDIEEPPAQSSAQSSAQPSAQLPSQPVLAASMAARRHLLRSTGAAALDWVLRAGSLGEGSTEEEAGGGVWWRELAETGRTPSSMSATERARCVERLPEEARDALASALQVTTGGGEGKDRWASSLLREAAEKLGVWALARRREARGRGDAERERERALLEAHVEALESSVQQVLSKERGEQGDISELDISRKDITQHHPPAQENTQEQARPRTRISLRSLTPSPALAPATTPALLALAVPLVGAYLFRAAVILPGRALEGAVAVLCERLEPAQAAALADFQREAMGVLAGRDGGEALALVPGVLRVLADAQEASSGGNAL